MVVSWGYNAGTNIATASGAGSTNFAALVAADTAGGWGKYTADSTGTQIKCTGRVVIGDGTNVCAFSDSGKQVLFYNFMQANDNNAIEVKANSTATFGVAINTTTKTSKHGCSIFVYDANYLGAGALYWATANAICYVYSSTLQNLRTNTTWDGAVYAGEGRVWNSTVMNTEFLLYSSSCDTYNCNFYSTRNGVDAPYGANASNLKALSAATSFNIRWNGCTWTNCESVSPTTRDFYFSDFGAGLAMQNVYLVNAVCGWNVVFQAAAVKVTVYRQHTFDLTTDTSATVVLKDNAGNTVFSVTSDVATGAIATQTVSRGYYNQANGDTLQDYGPFTLTISKAGKGTHTETLTLTEKTKLQISLENPGGGGGYIYKDRVVEKVVEKEDPLTEPLMMSTASLIVSNRLLKKKLILGNK